MLKYTVPFIIYALMLILSKMLMLKTKNKSNKTPFECGFSKMINMEMIPFSIQFFMLSIIFIIFDVEISILLASILPLNKWPQKEWSKTLFLFIMTMIISVIYEWKESAMYWTK